MSVEVSRQGLLEIRTYDHGKEIVKLLSCPFCGYEFDHREVRWTHFAEEHTPADVPGLSESPDTAADGGQAFVPAGHLYDPEDRTLTTFGAEWLDRDQEPPSADAKGLIPDGGHPENLGANSLEFPDLEERFGEQIVNTAAHVLNRDHLSNGPVQDDTIPSRIRGLDTPEEIAVYQAVERRMRNREEILESIRERAQVLQEVGHRPDDLERALLDPDADLPDRYRPQIPLWVTTDDLQEEREVPRDLDGPTRRSWGSSRPSGSSSPSSSRTSQATLAADGGEEP